MYNPEPITGEMVPQEKLIILPPEGGALAPSGPDKSPESGQNGSGRPAVGSDSLSGTALVCLSDMETVNMAVEKRVESRPNLCHFLWKQQHGRQRQIKPPKYPVGSCPDVEIICRAGSKERRASFFESMAPRRSL